MEDYRAVIDSLSGMSPKEAIKELLNLLIMGYEDYINGKITGEELSDITVHWYAVRKGFGDEMVGLDNRMALLAEGMDLTHPDFSNARKIQTAINLKMAAKQILRDYED